MTDNDDSFDTIPLPSDGDLVTFGDPVDCMSHQIQQINHLVYAFYKLKPRVRDRTTTSIGAIQ